MRRAEERAKQAYPYEGGTKGIICNDAIPKYIKGYEQAIKDVAEWVEKNAGKDIYKNYDSTGFRSYWSSGLAKNILNVFLGE